jgi:hypothetical protein
VRLPELVDSAVLACYRSRSWYRPCLLVAGRESLPSDIHHQTRFHHCLPAWRCHVVVCRPAAVVVEVKGIEKCVAVVAALALVALKDIDFQQESSAG